MADGVAPARLVISAYHAIGRRRRGSLRSAGGSIAITSPIRRGTDLEADPEELADLARDTRFADVVAEGERRLRATLDPEEVDARAKERQRTLLEGFGGREAALARGDLRFTPAPGTAPEMH